MMEKHVERLKDVEDLEVENFSDLKNLLIPVIQHNQLLSKEYAKMSQRLEAAEAAQDAITVAHGADISVETFAAMHAEEQEAHEDERVPDADDPYPEDEESLTSKQYRYLEWNFIQPNVFVFRRNQEQVVQR